MAEKKVNVYPVIIGGLAGLMVLFGVLSMQDPAKPETMAVSVVVNDSSDDRWNYVLDGMEAAAEENNVDLNVVTTPDFTNLEQENTVIRNEIANGAQGLIVQFSSSSDTEEAMAEFADAVLLELIDTDAAAPEEVNYGVVTGGPELGTAVSSEVIVHHDGSLEGERIAVLSGDLAQDALAQRYEAFVYGIEKAGGTVVWSGEGTEADLEDLRTHLGEVDILVGLTAKTLGEAMDIAGESALEIYGIGASNKTVYGVDAGLITSMVVPDDYSMGYQAVEALVERMHSHGLEGEKITVSYAVVNYDNLHTTVNERRLYRLS
jgi:ribose transport system substrate-binding protein